MIFLLLAILSSASISLIMRYGESKIKNNMAMFMANYMVCSILSIVFMNDMPLFTNEPGITVTVLLGIISGALYLFSFVLLQTNIEKNGVVLGATFAKLGVIIPTLIAIFIFKEQPRVLQVIGIILTIVAILIINYEKEEKDKNVHTFLLLLLLVFGGLTDSMVNIYDNVGNSVLKDHYLLYTFFFALIFASMMHFIKKEKVTKYDVIFGLVIGVPNYFSSRFLLQALNKIPAIITYPVYSILTLVIVSILGIVIFKEKLDKKKLIGLGIIVISLVLLNI